MPGANFIGREKMVDRNLVTASGCSRLIPIVKVEKSKPDEPKSVLMFEGRRIPSTELESQYKYGVDGIPA